MFKRMRLRFLVPLLLVASHAAAGVQYDFVTTIETWRATENVSGRVWVEGDSYRAEVTRAGGSRHGIISRDGDRTATLIDFQKNIATPRIRHSENVRSSALFAFPVGGAECQGVPEVQYRRGVTGVIAGQRAVEHIIEASFEVAGAHQVGGSYSIVARVWTAEELPALPMNSAIRTGYAVVDAMLERAAAPIAGMTLRHDLTITRTIDGGPPQSERTTTTVTRVERMQVPEERFTTH
jgi:hypothetical protein